jgi:lysophospholipase L1-like esterase
MAGSGVTDEGRLIDGLYHQNPACTFAAAESWVAIELEPGPQRLLAIWQDPGWNPYDVVTGGAPSGYRIETSTDGSDGSWEVAVEVTQNPVRVRGHSFDFAGRAWVRFVVTAMAGEATEAKLDEISLHDVSAAGTGLPDDTWLFMGDSITQGAFMRDLPAASRFESLVHAAHPDYTPAVVGAGIGAEFARDGLAHVADWLELNPDFRYFAIGYGTNDSWGNQSVGSFEATLEGIVTAVEDAGRIPILARIPFASDGRHETLPAFNAIIDAVTARHGLPCGPDFEAWFSEHPDELGTDGVHPNRTGYGSMNQLWADTVDSLYP